MKREKLPGEGGVSFKWRQGQKKRGGQGGAGLANRRRWTKRDRSGAKNLLAGRLLWSRLVPDHQNVTHLIKLCS